MVGLMMSNSEAESTMTVDEQAPREMELKKLLKMANALYKETAEVTTEIVGKATMSEEEAETIKEFGNTIFLILHQTAVAQLTKKLKESLSVHDLMNLRFPLQIKVLDYKRAERRKQQDAKRARKSLDGEADKKVGKNTDQERGKGAGEAEKSE